MADLDDIREGNKFNSHIETENNGFFLKGCNNLDWGMKDRLSRIFNPATGKTVMLAFDHGFIMGPTSGLERIDLNIVPLIPYADCIMCTRGMLRAAVPPGLNKPVCLRSDAGTSLLTELNHNIVIDVEEVIRLNVTAMAVMVAIGDPNTEEQSMVNLYQTADLGHRYGIPTMGVTAVGKDMARDARYFGLATRICAENGANIVKTYYTEKDFDKVVAACPVPIVIAGGKKLPELDALTLTYNAIQSGASGVDMGRNVFQSEHPAEMIQAIGAVVHQGLSPKAAFEFYETLVNASKPKVKAVKAPAKKKK